MSLNTLVHADEAGEAQDWLVDPASSPEAVYAEQEEVKRGVRRLPAPSAQHARARHL